MWHRCECILRIIVIVDAMKRFLVKIYCRVNGVERLKNKLLAIASVMKEHNLLFSEMVHKNQNYTGFVYVYVIYAEDILHICDLSDRLKRVGSVVVSEFEDIKKYNGVIFRHNKKNITDFIEYNMNCCGELEITADKKYMLRITYYDDEIIEGYINDNFDFSIDISPEVIRLFEEKYSLVIID